MHGRSLNNMAIRYRLPFSPESAFRASWNATDKTVLVYLGIVQLKPAFRRKLTHSSRGVAVVIKPGTKGTYWLQTILRSLIQRGFPAGGGVWSRMLAKP